MEILLQTEGVQSESHVQFLDTSGFLMKSHEVALCEVEDVLNGAFDL